MNLPSALISINWMIRDTIRQSLASKLFWLMLGFTAICVIFCLGVSVKDGERLPIEKDIDPLALPKNDPLNKTLGKEGITAAGVDVLGNDELSLGFGAFKITTNRGRADSVKFLQVWVAGLVAGTVGIFLAVIWTAGFLPSFLDPNHATVLLAKPIPRWSMLLGKMIGVMAFAAIQSSIFVVGTWLAIGIATGIYDLRYLLAIPILLVHFGVFYSFSVMLAVWTRSTVVCIFGTLLFWVLAWGMNYGRHAMIAYDPPGLSQGSKTVTELAYWIIPKPADMNAVFDELLDVKSISQSVPELEVAKQRGRLNLGMSLLASIFFGFVMTGISMYEFKKAEY